MPLRIPENGFYMHYRHDPNGSPYNYMYEVVGLARNTEEGSYSVLYRPLYQNDWLVPATYFSRPLAMFVESIEHAGVVVPRFTKMTDSLLLAELATLRDKLYPTG